MKEFISNSVEDTTEIAKKLFLELKGGDVLALSGNLGAGKTVFVKALANILGIEDNITSPTFVLMKEYKTNNKEIKKLIHVDCYRLDVGENLDDIGLGDYLQDSETLVVIEWADKVLDLPRDTVNIKIDYLDNNKRKIVVEK